MTHGGIERQGDVVAFARQVIDAEIAGMAAVRDRLGAEFEKALQLVMECQGK